MAFKQSQAMLDMLAMAERENRIISDSDRKSFAESDAERSMDEKSWMWTIIHMAEDLGYSYFHAYDSRRSNPGYPDLHLWKPGRMLWIETKTNNGKLTADQQRVIEELRAAGGEVHVLRPKHGIEEVDRILKGQS